MTAEGAHLDALTAEHVMSLSKSCVVLAVVAGVAGCEGLGGGGGGGGPFDLRLLLVPSPGSTTTQALCDQGTDVADRAQALVDTLNDEVASDRALLAAIATAEARTEGLITTYEANVDGRTMVVEVLSDGAGSEVITGTIDGEAALEATTANDGATGTLTFGDLAVTWTESEGTLQATRSGAASAVVSLEDNLVRLVVDGVVAAWSDSEGVVIDGEVLCFSGEELCTASCDGIDTDALAGEGAAPDFDL